LIRRIACVGAGSALVLGSLVIVAPAAHAVDPFPAGFAAAFVLGGIALIRPARRRTRGDIRLRRTFRR
jgi:hypothetical protein